LRLGLGLILSGILIPDRDPTLSQRTREGWGNTNLGIRKVGPAPRRFRFPAFAKNAKDGAPLGIGYADEFKSPGHPPGEGPFVRLLRSGLVSTISFSGVARMDYSLSWEQRVERSQAPLCVGNAHESLKNVPDIWIYLIGVTLTTLPPNP